MAASQQALLWEALDRETHLAIASRRRGKTSAGELRLEDRDHERLGRLNEEDAAERARLGRVECLHDARDGSHLI